MIIESYSVSYINNYLKNIIESDPFLRKITIKGEISNLSWRGGHAYFSLKDDDSSLRAILFAGDRRNIVYDLKNGDEVLAFGNIELYMPNGTYQIIVKDMMPYGEGSRLINLEKLRLQLQDEGLFAHEHKKSIPTFPKTVGVITARDGAAIHDIYSNIIKRYPIAKIHLFAAAVQGKNAEKELLTALKHAIDDRVDVIIIGRGGGDSGDLTAFNEEMLVRAIYECPIPIISAVGHESDTTLVDFVADLRASTPTEAAVLATPSIVELTMRIAEFYQTIEQATRDMMEKQSEALNYHIRIIRNKYPIHELERQYQLLAYFKEKLHLRVVRFEEEMRRLVGDYRDSIERHTCQKIDDRQNSLTYTTKHLKTIDPYHLLERGYAINITDDGKIITSIDDVKMNTKMKTILKDGKIMSNITGKEAK